MSGPAAVGVPRAEIGVAGRRVVRDQLVLSLVDSKAAGQHNLIASG